MALRVEAREGLEDLGDVWTELAKCSGNLFVTWEWARVWWRHFGRGRRARVLLWYDGDELAAIVPLCVVAAGPLRLARLIGYGRADELGPVSRRGDARGYEALARSRQQVGASVLLAERLSGPGAESLGGAELRRESSPVVAIRGLSWDDYLASRSANARSQLRRKERKLQREHGLSYRLADDPRRLSADVDVLLRLHAARWGAATSGALAGVNAAFHHDFARVALERGWLRLWFAEANGAPVAAWYGFRFGGAEWYYQLGRDPAWDRSSVGVVLIAHTIREAILAGLAEYKLLRGGESYKDRFATSDPGVATVAFAGGAAGHAAVVAARAATRLPTSAQHRLRRGLPRAVGAVRLIRG